MVPKEYKQPTKRGVALLEAMIATGILSYSVLAISSAIIAGQKQSVEARNTIVASVAAESLLSAVAQEEWESIDSWHGYTEDIGEISDPGGMPVEGDWSVIGRTVAVSETDLFIEQLQIFLIGRTVTVTTFDNTGRELTSVHRFIPEPQS